MSMILNAAPQVPWTPGGTIAPGRFCKATTGTMTAIQCSVAGENSIGVSGLDMLGAPGLTGSDTAVHANTTAAGKNNLKIRGNPGDVVQVYAGGSITASGNIMTDTDGKCVAYSAGSASFSGSANYCLGVALYNASSGEIVQVKLDKAFIP